MSITNLESGTNVHEIAAGIYRINTPVSLPGGEFSFNQYLIAGDEPLVFHTGPRKLFPLVRAAAQSVLPVERDGTIPVERLQQQLRDRTGPRSCH